MSSLLLRGAAGAGCGPAPVTLPEAPAAEDLDRELVDLLSEDPGWVDETFREIVATSWAEPPRGGAARSDARPRRFGVPRRGVARRDGSGRSQWCPRPQGRQRAPP
jgi:hypothetical protein